MDETTFTEDEGIAVEVIAIAVGLYGLVKMARDDGNDGLADRLEAKTTRMDKSLVAEIQKGVALESIIAAVVKDYRET